ncbi:MAG TPA: M42 family metallopeptidase [Anaerolineales bacterium]|nr:M42 family metallopeptidase [Anaerolineales bacterium]
MKKLLQKLTDTFSPSGYEDAIRDLIRAEIKPLADEVRVDALGNLIARKGRGGKRVMIAAHMDEIGLIVSHVDERGFARFAPIGGVFGRYLLGGRVRFLNGAQGLIGYDRLEHVTEIPSADKMFIDIGATSPKDCPVEIGDVAAFERPFLDLGQRVIAKSLDNRTGVLVAIETLRALKSTPNEVYVVFTTQEEIGSRGAGAAAFGLDPEIGIAVDVTPSGDTPDSFKLEVALGKGAAIKISDVGMIADPRVVSWMTRVAEKAHIPYQREVLTIGSTDARSIQTSRSGVLSGALSIPVRYVHSPSEMVDMNDVQNSVKLLTALLKSNIELG